MKDLIRKIENWGAEKGIISKDNSFKQFTKHIEESGEIASALCKNEPEKLKDSIGDSTVTLILLAKQNGLNFEDCLETAWNEIKNRTGKTENGIFIKN